jgi:hypothetical protein
MVPAAGRNCATWDSAQAVVMVARGGTPWMHRCLASVLCTNTSTVFGFWADVGVEG